MLLSAGAERACSPKGKGKAAAFSCSCGSRRHARGGGTSCGAVGGLAKDWPQQSVGLPERASATTTTEEEPAGVSGRAPSAVGQPEERPPADEPKAQARGRAGGPKGRSAV